MSAFVISKTHMSSQKPRRRQLNTKMYTCHFSYSFFLSCQDHDVQQRYLKNGLSAHRHFCTKLMLISARSSTTTRRLHSFKFTLVNNHSQHSEAAVRCLGCHFLILYTCTQEVSFPDQRLRSLVWKRDEYTSEIASGQYSTQGWHSLFPPWHWARLEHHVGKALHSAAYF